MLDYPNKHLYVCVVWFVFLYNVWQCPLAILFYIYKHTHILFNSNIGVIFILHKSKGFTSRSWNYGMHYISFYVLKRYILRFANWIHSLFTIYYWAIFLTNWPYQIIYIAIASGVPNQLSSQGHWESWGHLRQYVRVSLLTLAPRSLTLAMRVEISSLDPAGPPHV